MIKTQLCPSSELENKNWWHIDAVILILVAIASYLVVDAYFEGVRADIARLQERKVQWEQDLAKMQTGLEKFKSLNAEIALLNRKIGALQRITTSKIDKIKPLVAMDQLQTLWIEGVWYEELDYNASGVTRVVASAHDSILVGEYMLGLRETMNLDTRNDDVRTQLGFEDLALKMASLVPAGDEIFRDIAKKMKFDLTAKHVEKRQIPTQAATVTLGPRPRALGPLGF